MGFLDTFKGNQYKSEVEALKQECERLKSLFTPEMQNIDFLKNETARLQNEVSSKQQQISDPDGR